MKTAKEILDFYDENKAFPYEMSTYGLLEILASLEERLDKLESKDINPELISKDTNSSE